MTIQLLSVAVTHRVQLTMALALVMSAGLGCSSPVVNGSGPVPTNPTPDASVIHTERLDAPAFEIAIPADVAPMPADLASGAPAPAPADFTKTESGGFKLGPPLTTETANSAAGQTNCNYLIGVVRDFKARFEAGGGHPDFEAFGGTGISKGLVGNMLGPDRKPVYTGRCQAPIANMMMCPYGAQTTSAERFAQWYSRAEGVNQPFLIYFAFAAGAGGVSTFNSQSFFPLDGAGFGNSGNDEQMRRRNFHFTTELHATIRYNGGEHFTFSGDDDLWVFINDKLALDVGGLHPAQTLMVDLDASAATLGLTKGKVYPIDLFHAERRTDASHFRVDTNFMFVDCGRVVD
jgi:fibro-slime domain-containing protein